MICWKKSIDGFVESHCGLWDISPLYWGCETAQSYELTYRPKGERSKRVGSSFDTQRAAKKAASTYVCG